MGANASFYSLQFFDMDVLYSSDFVRKSVESGIHRYKYFLESLCNLHEILVVIRYITVLTDVWLLQLNTNVFFLLALYGEINPFDHL